MTDPSANHLIGACLGASNVKLVVGTTAGGRFRVLETVVEAHNGNVRAVVERLLRRFALPHSQVAVTGRRLRNQVLLPTLSEIEATEAALDFLRPGLPELGAVASVGGENFMVYELDRDLRIIATHTGNKCASGTGEFYRQQLRRIGLSFPEAEECALVDAPYKISSRCSVFSKSDCTHALNKGKPKGAVVAGLSSMLAGKIVELLRGTGARKILLAGGVAQNRVVNEYLQREGFQVVDCEYKNVFEALGAALWAEQHGAPCRPGEIWSTAKPSFERFPPLTSVRHDVTFVSSADGDVTPDADYVLGVDAGSTTTKAVLIRQDNRQIVAKVYLRTNGDPVRAARQCYRDLAGQVPPGLRIIGLGVTGSGRQIVGLHGLTTNIVNEIIAHNTAAVHFDPAVDTILEIGGQDAKYTFTVGRVPADYAMNEACSAGTGSFLEEAARESLGIATESIADYALRATRPPNFNDQCAAFIGSDIKTAIQEGLDTEDIAAGLVYAVCQNYLTRVKGSRPLGKRVFMQGGVCYNRAVPLAMAALIKRPIIVPPDPGLMGAFGVALEVLGKLESGAVPRGAFSLTELADRTVEYGEPFECRGGREKCDRKCTIARISVDGKTYPFGGACNMYYNLRLKAEPEAKALDLVAWREALLYDRAASPPQPNGKTVGLSKALMTGNLYPMYHTFLTALGFSIILEDKPDPRGSEKRKAPFCYPVEQAHGLFASLLARRPDYILVPHVRATPVVNGSFPSTTCPLVQGEPYVLRRTFQREIGETPFLIPVLNMPDDYTQGEGAFVRLGADLGCAESASRAAFAQAVTAQREFIAQLKQAGTEALERARGLAMPTVVLLGRAYNAFSRLGNLGIPNKFASRGVLVIPHDMLDTDADPPIDSMHWAAGQSILKAARRVRETPGVYACFITNFSCGPDSFIVNFVRQELGDKPSLTLELDSHTADAGIDTRIEAFLDIAAGHLARHGRVPLDPRPPVPQFASPSLRDKRVRLLIPSMGAYGSRALAAVFEYLGVRTHTLAAPTEADLQRGKDLSSCKECLPLALTLGTLYNYLDTRPADEHSVYFMPKTSGSCRFAQYSVLTRYLIERDRIPNLTLLSLTSQNAYGGLGLKFARRALWATTIADVLEEIRAAILSLAEDRAEGLRVYTQAEDMLLEAIATKPWSELLSTLRDVAEMLRGLRLVRPLSQAPKVALIGEIYVRRDGFSQRFLVESLAEKGIVALQAPLAEWLYYTNYLAIRGLRGKATWLGGMQHRGKAVLMQRYERVIKGILASSGLYDYHLIDIPHLVRSVSSILNPELTGEAILTLACALNDIVDRVDGVISIGPFGCMPGRLAEALIKQSINSDKRNICHDPELASQIMALHPHLPFLSLESDGSPFPLVYEASIESFILQTKRLHQTRQKLCAVT
jgi:predicted CoA-substrate-specific enzyme activase